MTAMAPSLPILSPPIARGGGGGGRRPAANTRPTHQVARQRQTYAVVAFHLRRDERAGKLVGRDADAQADDQSARRLNQQTQPLHRIDDRALGQTLARRLDKGTGRLLYETEHKEPRGASSSMGWGWELACKSVIFHLHTGHVSMYYPPS